MADKIEEAPVSEKLTDDIDGCVSSKTTSDENGNDNSNGESKAAIKSQNGDGNHEEHSDNESPEPYFAPKVHLPIVVVNTMEDNEDVLVELRARIYRYDDSDDEPEFKERGTGVVKILHNKKTDLYRILMRRDKTLKICANHHIQSSMELNPHNNSQKVFVYSTLADLYEGEITPETFAIRFSGPENATIFKNAFDDAVTNIKRKEKEQQLKKLDEVDCLTKDMENVNIIENKNDEKQKDED